MEILPSLVQVLCQFEESFLLSVWGAMVFILKDALVLQSGTRYASWNMVGSEGGFLASGLRSSVGDPYHP